MVSPNTAAASLSRSKRASTNGFDVVASHLSQIMHTTFKTDSKKSSKGVVNTAHQSLKSAFADSLKGTKKATHQSTSNPSYVTPSTTRTSRELRSSSTISTNRSTPSQDCSDANEAEDRLDIIRSCFSSTTRAAKRLRIGKILRLGYHNEFTVFIPSFHNKNEAKQIRAGRAQTMEAFRRVILNDTPHDWTSDEKDDYYQMHLKSREVSREGRVGHEFNVRVQHYPERERMNVDHLPLSETNYILNPSTGVGLNCELIGYGNSVLVLLRITNLPFIEIYVPRKADEEILTDLKFPKSSDDAVVAGFLAREFLETKGDPVAYANIMINYYRMKWYQSTANTKKEQQARLDEDEKKLLDTLKEEVNRSKLDKFAQYVDSFYESAIESTIDFSSACSYLVSDVVVAEFYHCFKRDFPAVHKVLCSVVESDKYTEPPLPQQFNPDSCEPLHKKQRMMLFIFFAALRAQSRVLLKYWALVEPLGTFFKGNQQPSSRSFSGLFTSTLNTSFTELEKIYEERLPSFLSTVEEQSLLFGAFDNYQKVLPKKDQTEHKSAVTHIATSYYAKKEKPIYVPRGSYMTSPTGIKFKVMKCKRHSDDNWLLYGEVYSVDDANRNNQDAIDAERKLIREGFSWPRLGWEVHWMPGFVPRESLQYFHQVVPPPRRAWVASNASDADIAFGSRTFTDAGSGAVSFTSERMYRVHCLARRLVEMKTHAYHLQQTVDDSQDFTLLHPEQC